MLIIYAYLLIGIGAVLFIEWGATMAITEEEEMRDFCDEFNDITYEELESMARFYEQHRHIVVPAVLFGWFPLTMLLHLHTK